MITIRLTETEYERLKRPVSHTQQGGFQRLIGRLQLGLRGDTRELRMNADDARAVVAYANPKYGAGTYQAILRSIEPQVTTALREAGAADTGSLFADAFGDDDA